MTKKVKIKLKLNNKGVQALLKSEEMQTVVKKYAMSVRARCGDGYETDTYIGNRKCMASIWADSLEAKKNEMDNNTLIKALGGK